MLTAEQQPQHVDRSRAAGQLQQQPQQYPNPGAQNAAHFKHNV